MAVARVVEPLNVAFPGQNAPLTAQQGAQPVSPWWQFWRNLWLRTGGDNGVDAALLKSDLSNAEVLGVMLAATKVTPLPPLPLPITPGASPYSYQAPMRGYVLVTGGTVSAVAMARDGSTLFAFPTAGPVPVAKGDVVKVTYTGVPTMTMVGL
jgi:hypothetical protein